MLRYFLGTKMVLSLVIGGNVGKNSVNKDTRAAIISISIAVQLIIWFIAVAVAMKCNSGKGMWKAAFPVIGAVFFPEIYILQHVVRKSLLNQPGYCQ